MGGIDLAVEMTLIVLLGMTLLYAMRLQRALSGLRHDRAALQQAVEGFDSGTRHAEAELARMREAAAQLGAQLGHAAALRDDLAFLSERGETLADRLDALVRAGRNLELRPPAPVLALSAPAGPTINAEPQGLQQLSNQLAPRVRSQAERMLLAALQARQ